MSLVSQAAQAADRARARVCQFRLRELLLQYTPERISAMQRELACAFPYMLWSSIYGAWGAESGHRDAFEALLGTLARRAANTPFEERSVCPAEEVR